ncbi:MAG TPA: PLP-dependent aminotransferase family protein [Pyrinomonadaceae bacterium]|nr:PLP-dependent aminotransferase family protein [Pyrinomonadaceae bacterium]
MKKKATAAIFPLIPFERTSSVPFYKQLYEGYRAAILSGRLSPGQRLPSTRALAADLRISRLPIVNAFEQLLHEGYIEGKTGLGTFVNNSIPDDLSRPVLAPRRDTRQGRPVQQTRSAGVTLSHSNTPSNQGALGPFRVSLPALEHFPHKLWSGLVSRHAKSLSIELMAYGEPSGYWPLREAIAQYLRTARAVRCEASQVLIVSGSQMALQICALALLKPGDAVCIEDPGYPEARKALGISGATLIPIPVDDEGIDVTRIASLTRRAHAVYVTPSHQYPLGVSMSAARRLELLDWARRNRSWIIEDDYDSEFRYASRPVGALQGMDAESQVIYMGTFSKVLFPSLRIGYMVVPPALLTTFTEIREALDIFSPTLYQLVLTDFLQEGHFARHLRRMRAVYEARRNALVYSLGETCGEVLKLYNADAGLHLTALLPKSFDDCELVSRAAQRGISATALSSCFATKASRSGLILGFGGADEERIKAAVQVLAELIRDRV